MQLKCKHFTTKERVIVYINDAPKGKTMCEACGKWREYAPLPARVPIPDEPLF